MPKKQDTLVAQRCLAFFVHVHLLFWFLFDHRGGPKGLGRSPKGSKWEPHMAPKARHPGGARVSCFWANCGSHFERLGLRPCTFGPPGGQKGTQKMIQMLRKSKTPWRLQGALLLEPFSASILSPWGSGRAFLGPPMVKNKLKIRFKIAKKNKTLLRHRGVLRFGQFEASISPVS